MLKVGLAHLEKAKGFGSFRGRNWLQSLRYAELALTKLKPLKDRSLAFIEILDEALTAKNDALSFMGRDREALECATERYNMWATTFMRNSRTIEAAFPLIETLTNNKEFAQAHLIAHTIYEMTMHPMTHDIPEDLQQPLLAKAANRLALATFRLARYVGIPPEEEQKAGEDAIALARKALEIDTQLYRADDIHIISDMSTLANVLNHFNGDDNEVIRLYEQVIAIHSRLEGSSTINVAINKHNMGNAYYKRMYNSIAANDLDRCLANLELALPYYREAAVIFGAVNHVDKAKEATEIADKVEESIGQLQIQLAGSAPAAAATATPPPTTTTTATAMTRG